MNAETEPAVSVVVPSVSGTSAIFECLAALADQDDETPAEVVVVDRCGEATRDAIRARFPEVRLVAMDRGSPLPDMRGRGVAEARGRMIAVLGEHLRPARTWLRTIGEAPRDDRNVTFGPVESGGLTHAAEWAFFLSEYAPCMSPVAAGPAALPGSNCAYPRSLLDRVGARGGEPLWDFELRGRLVRAGVRFACAPGLSARSEKRLGIVRLLAHRHHCSRSYAAHRSRRWPAWKRAAFALATPLLPPVVLARIVGTVAAKRRYRRQLVRVLPLLAAISVVWAFGEAVGCLLGPGLSPALLE